MQEVHRHRPGGGRRQGPAEFHAVKLRVRSARGRLSCPRFAFEVGWRWESAKGTAGSWSGAAVCGGCANMWREPEPMNVI